MRTRKSILSRLLAGLLFVVTPAVAEAQYYYRHGPRHYPRYHHRHYRPYRYYGYPYSYYRYHRPYYYYGGGYPYYYSYPYYPTRAYFHFDFDD